ncbi:MAG: DNA replication and repair protein RecF [Spirochaetales bacterium]|nr:DNA replication and repair protein RecF [Spirochaetales bacterium]
MGFTTLKTFDFRNLKNQTIELGNTEIFLTGENGQGKSNFLEAVYILSYGSSFRTRQDNILIQQGAKEMTLFGEYSGKGEISNSVSVNISGKGKKIYYNGKTVRDRKDLIQNIPCIIFSHEDLSFVNGTPERKRWFFNQTISLYDSGYIDSLRKYRKILKLRNFEVKNKRSDLLDVYNNQLAVAGIEIQKMRSRITGEFNKTFSPLFRKISGLDEELIITYLPSWKNCENEQSAVDKLESKREADFFLGSTSTGPHRDIYKYKLSGYDFARIASTGQLRLISLVLRIAQSIFFLKKTGRKPLLLLDDVLLELDNRRRMRFLELLPEYEQIFFTFLPGEHFNEYRMEDTAVLNVTNGVIERI